MTYEKDTGTTTVSPYITKATIGNPDTTGTEEAISTSITIVEKPGSDACLGARFDGVEDTKTASNYYKGFMYYFSAIMKPDANRIIASIKTSGCPNCNLCPAFPPDLTECLWECDYGYY